MFAEQINGGLQEVCETTYKGVPFSSLNNAARINVGIDIINTLSTHYGIYDKYSETSWTIPLRSGALMSHEVRKVVQI